MTQTFKICSPPLRRLKNSIKQRKQRSQGFGRKQKLPVTQTINFYPEICCHCGESLSKAHAEATCYTAYYQLDLQHSNTGIGGYIGTHTKNKLFETLCGICHHKTKYQAKEKITSESKIVIKEWQLIGSTLSSVIVYLTCDMGTTIRKIQSLLKEVFNINLYVGIINKSLHETGLAAEPVTEELKTSLHEAYLLHAGETSWKEGKQALWLWVFITTNICLFLIGGRTKKK